MAMEADPRATFELVLTQHQGIEAAAVPALVFRYPTRRQAKGLRRLQDRLQAMTEATTDAEAAAWADEAESALVELLAGWRNQLDEDGAALAFAAVDLDRVIDDGDLGELVARLLTEPLLRVAEKKRSGLRSSLSTGSSAETSAAGAGAAVLGSGGSSSVASSATATVAATVGGVAVMADSR